jgi:hypothetical protein
VAGVSLVNFEEGVAILKDLVGLNELVGSVEVDQVFAHNQHEELGYRHLHGGQAKYLEEPFFARVEEYLANIAVDFPEVNAAMIENMTDLAEQVYQKAPHGFFGVLRGSAHPTVVSDGVLIYDRPPIWPRLSEAEASAIERGAPHEFYNITEGYPTEYAPDEANTRRGMTPEEAKAYMRAKLFKRNA